MGKGKIQGTRTCNLQEFKFSAKQNLSKPRNTQTGLIFLFDKPKAKEAPVKSKKCLKSSSKTRRRKGRRQRKTNQYTLRDKELKIEEVKRAQRQHNNWRKRQVCKLKRVTEVMVARALLVKRVSWTPKLKRTKRSRVAYTTSKMERKTIRTIHIAEEEEPWRYSRLENANHQARQ